jgi:hypothetical protein
MNRSAKKKLINPKRVGIKIRDPPDSSIASGKRSKKATPIKAPAAKLIKVLEKVSVISFLISKKKLPTKEAILPMNVKIIIRASIMAFFKDNRV